MRRLINRRRQGDLGEASAIEWLTLSGASVLLPVGHSPDYDLLADVAGHLHRIQVKTSVHKTGVGRYGVQLATLGGNQSWSGLRKTFDPARIDFLFVHVGDGRRWFIPSDAVEGKGGIILGGKKYSEFEIRRGAAIDSAVYGGGEQASRIERPARGSADVGESGETVNFVPKAEWVRIPPPPSIPRHPPAERKLGRSGQAVVRPKRQMTIPVKPYSEAGLEPGDRIRFRAEGPGRIVLELIEPPATIFDAA